MSTDRLTPPEVARRVTATTIALCAGQRTPDAIVVLFRDVAPTSSNLAMLLAGVAHRFAQYMHAAHPNAGGSILRMGDGASRAGVLAGRLLVSAYNQDAETHAALLGVAARIEETAELQEIVETLLEALHTAALHAHAHQQAPPAPPAAPPAAPPVRGRSSRGSWWRFWNPNRSAS